jgi:hypothetical protein
MAVLVNHVILENGIPSRLHFTDHRIERRTITEPGTGQTVIRQVLAFTVDRLDGRAVEAELSTMAEKLAGQFEPYLKDKSYRNYEVIITQIGEGFQRRWTVQFIPFATR